MSRILLEAGVDMLARDSSGFAPIHLAADLGNPELLEIFFDKAQRRLNEIQGISGLRPASEIRVPALELALNGLIKRFVTTDKAKIMCTQESCLVAVCRTISSPHEIGKGMIYLACRRSPGLMQTLPKLGVGVEALGRWFHEMTSWLGDLVGPELDGRPE